MGIGCSPVALHLTHDDAPVTQSVHTLIRNESVSDLISNIPFQDEHFSHEMKCVLQVHTENKMNTSNEQTLDQMNITHIEKIISWSGLPGLNDT